MMSWRNMKEKKDPHPPRWAEHLLAWYCRRELLEDLQGDLNEYFQRNLETKGLRRARLIYVIDVLKFFRLYTVRKPEFINLLIHWLMIGSYIKTSGRSIVRNKLFSAINIAGLAVSMSVGLLTLSIVRDLFSYDSFHEKKDRIYRVITADQHKGGSPFRLATSSVRAGDKICESITGVERVTLMRRGFGGDAIIDNQTIPLSGLWADESFFDVFTFPLLRGSRATALKEPYSIVLTETTAHKLFGAAEPLGRTVKFDTTTYVVTGLMKDLPKLSHMKFEALVSFSTVVLQKPDLDGDFFGWQNIFSNYTYVVLPENGDAKTVQAALDKLCAAENVGMGDHQIMLKLQPLQLIPMDSKLANSIGPSINQIGVWILAGLALVVILSACVNYTNLSIARALRRSREVGIRKIMGAFRGHVRTQFMIESVIIALLSLFFSFLFFLFLRTQFLSFSPFLASLLTLELSPGLVVWFICLAVAVGIVAGFLPALFFSRINAIKVLKDVSSVKVFHKVSLRKALVVVQYTFSLIFITTTIIGYQQYRGLLTFDLGFSTGNVLNIHMQGNKNDLFIKELSELPAITAISKSRIITSTGNIYGMHAKYKDPNDSASILLNYVDEHYLPLHGYKLIAGKNFSARPSHAEESEVIVNIQFLNRFNISPQDPAKALGEQIVTPEGKKLTIIGVMKDFHYGTLEDKISPVAFRYSAEETHGFVNAKIVSTDLPSTMAAIEAAWQKVDRVHPLKAEFYDDQIEQTYNQFSVMIKVIGFLAFLAVCVSSLGLLGMVVFTTETRLKEISIRKVMGAGEGSLVLLLSRGFLVLLVVAMLIALPATWMLFDKVVLPNFAYHQPLNMWGLIAGSLIVMGIACVMIGWQTLKTARTNPAKVLKNE